MKKILLFIPILNFYFIIKFIVVSMSKLKIGYMFANVLVWIAIMIGFAITRAIVTEIFEPMQMFLLVDTYTYLSLYISITLGAIYLSKKTTQLNTSATKT